MTKKPNFTFSIHAPPVRVVASDVTTGLLFEFSLDYGPSVNIYTDDAELTRKLGAAINAVLEDHWASSERPGISEDVE